MSGLNGNGQSKIATAIRSVFALRVTYINIQCMYTVMYPLIMCKEHTFDIISTYLKLYNNLC